MRLRHAGFQSTRPRGARPSTFPKPSSRNMVSIHAPARGATASPVTSGVASDVSIHAPARGATDGRLPTPAGGPVSIHAPARGATCRRPRDVATSIGFNPRARAGRDIPDARIRPPGTKFQSTRPRGARHWPCLSVDGQHNSFNPRARAGRDACLAVIAAQHRGFNPRARAGRDVNEIAPRESFTVFQSTRPRGARLGMAAVGVILMTFQSTRPRGARRRQGDSCPRCQGFQSTRPRGARPQKISVAATTMEVSIHAPARGATSPHARGCLASCSFNPRARAGRDIRGTVRHGT